MPKSLKPGNEIEPPASRRVPLTYRPPGSSEHHVRTGENWEKVAARYGLTARNLIYYNFKTNVPQEVNWYLHWYVNCDTPTPDHFNWSFTDTAHLGASPRAGIIYVPLTEIVIDDPEPVIGTAPRWQDIEFWFEGTVADIAVGVIFKGELAMRYTRKPSDWHCWPLSLTLAGRSLGWSGVTPFSTVAIKFRVDTHRFKPKKTWDGKHVSASYSGTKLALTVHDAFELTPGDPSPVKGAFLGRLQIPLIIPTHAGGGAIGFYTMLGKVRLGKGRKCPRGKGGGGGSVWA
jgi:hypothetical protein